MQLPQWLLGGAREGRGTSGHDVRFESSTRDGVWIQRLFFEFTSNAGLHDMTAEFKFNSRLWGQSKVEKHEQGGSEGNTWGMRGQLVQWRG
jgi:hypothetical protein